MNRDPHKGIECSQFEALLADALDFQGEGDAESLIGEAESLAGGSLVGEARQAFLAHRKQCQVCGPLFDEALRGMMLLRSIEEVEPPQNLLHNILAATSHVEASAPGQAARTPGWLERFKNSLRPAFGGMLHSRFATSFAMAFFSVSLTLSLAGVSFGEIFKAAAHPSTFRRTVVLQYTQVEARVVSYYDNMRVVYEWQSRVERLKKAVAPAGNNNDVTKPEQQNQNRPVPNTRPEQEENSSQVRDESTIAKHTLQLEGAQL